MDLFLELALVIATVLGTVGTMILQHQGNQHLKEQNRIMREQAGGTPTETDLTVFRPSRWPLVAMIAMVILVWLVVGYDYFDRHHARVITLQDVDWNAWGNQRLTDIYGQTFSNETIEVDGKNFIGTKFENVLLMYEGKAPMKFTNVDFPHPFEEGHTVRIGSGNLVVRNAMQLSEAMAELAGCGAGYKYRPKE